MDWERVASQARMSDSTAPKPRVGVTESAEAGVGGAKTETGVSEAGASESGVLRERRVNPGSENQIVESGVHEVPVKARVLKVSIKSGVLKIRIESRVKERTEGAAAESTAKAAPEATPAAKETRTSLQYLGKEAGLSCKAVRKSYGRGT